MRRTRRRPRPSASTVRPPSTVSPTVPVIVAYAARSQRYPAGARFRYHRVPIRIAGSPTRHDSAATGLTRTAATTVSRIVTPEMSVSGNREAHRACERVDVRGRARDEIARARPLDDGERQREHLAHEVLAQVGEHLLREHERRAPREPGEHRLRDHRDDEHGDDAVDVRGRRALVHRLDEVAEQERPDEPGQRGERVQAEDDGERAPVAAQQHGRIPADSALPRSAAARHAASLAFGSVARGNPVSPANPLRVDAAAPHRRASSGNPPVPPCPLLAA